MDGPGEAALTNVRRAVDLLRPLGASSLLGVALNNLGDVYYGLGDLDSARRLSRFDVVSGHGRACRRIRA